MVNGRRFWIEFRYHSYVSGRGEDAIFISPCNWPGGVRQLNWGVESDAVPWNMIIPIDTSRQYPTASIESRDNSIGASQIIKLVELDVEFERFFFEAIDPEAYSTFRQVFTIFFESYYLNSILKPKYDMRLSRKGDDLVVRGMPINAIDLMKNVTASDLYIYTTCNGLLLVGPPAPYTSYAFNSPCFFNDSYLDKRFRYNGQINADNETVQLPGFFSKCPMLDRDSNLYFSMSFYSHFLETKHPYRAVILDVSTLPVETDPASVPPVSLHLLSNPLVFGLIAGLGVSVVIIIGLSIALYRRKHASTRASSIDGFEYSPLRSQVDE